MSGCSFLGRIFPKKSSNQNSSNSSESISASDSSSSSSFTPTSDNFNDPDANAQQKTIKQMLDAAYNDAQSILKEHYDKLDAIAQRLLVTEKINADEFKGFFE